MNEVEGSGQNGTNNCLEGQEASKGGLGLRHVDRDGGYVCVRHHLIASQYPSCTMKALYEAFFPMWLREAGPAGDSLAMSPMLGNRGGHKKQLLKCW